MLHNRNRLTFGNLEYHNAAKRAKMEQNTIHMYEIQFNICIQEDYYVCIQITLKYIQCCIDYIFLNYHKWHNFLFRSCNMSLINKILNYILDTCGAVCTISFCLVIGKTS
jgi:hypothetical protein